MRHVHTVVFDLGGVLVGFDDDAIAAVLAPGLGLADWWRFIVHHPVARAFETGRSTRSEFAVAGATLCRVGVDERAFLGAFAAWATGPFPGAAEAVARVRAAGLRALVLSNTNAIHWALHVERGLDKWFDGVITSHAAGALKPDAPIFAALEAIAGGPAGGLLFLDDNPVNVGAARARGWQARRVLGVVEVHLALDEVVGA